MLGSRVIEDLCAKREVQEQVGNLLWKAVSSDDVKSKLASLVKEVIVMDPVVKISSMFPLGLFSICQLARFLFRANEFL